MTRQSFPERSYRSHSEHYNDYVPGGAQEQLARTWLSEDNVGAWRHMRMYRLLDPLLRGFRGATWLTIGDGRFGSDAHYIESRAGRAVATDITDALLAEAQAIGFITEYRQENAEALSFADETFDFVLCKESYHHFPRPMIALYEMLRVARQAVILIEPRDPYISSSLREIARRRCANLAKIALGRKLPERHSFESSGNYIYAVSERELEKAALGIGLPAIAFAGLNDYYEAGVEYETATADNPVFRRVANKIHRPDQSARLGFRQYGLLVAVLAKQMPAPELSHALRTAGYEIRVLPSNPFISKDDS
jgi:ubiquinone/menaquinone biosynthesis C-methylase UbiE